jgi:hypothetical protein
MPATLRTPENYGTDPKTQCGAYLTDGQALYRVLRIDHEPTQVAGSPYVRVILENAMTLDIRRCDPNAILKHFRLIEMTELESPSLRFVEWSDPLDDVPEVA